MRMEIFEFAEPFGLIVKGLVLTPLAVLWTMLSSGSWGFGHSRK
jgi:hypothetical protein